MLDVGDALARVVAACRPTTARTVALDDAHGLHLAEEVIAPYGVPEFANSAMDGYAVLASDIERATDAAPVTLPIVGASKAGTPPPPLTPGTAMRIYTGAPIPQGADAVVMQENVKREQDRGTFTAPCKAGAIVREASSDVRAAEAILSRHANLDAGAIGLLASLGVARVAVFARPRVAILSTGDELRDLDSPRTPFTIVNSNAHALAALVREAGGEPWVLERVPDDRNKIAAAITRGLSADLLLTSGGVSVGDFDFVQEALAASDVALEFWRVAMKPGKPMMFGRSRLHGTPVIGLPGNPASAMVTFELFARPAIRTMLGSLHPYRSTIEVELGHHASHGTGRVEFARASLATTTASGAAFRATFQRPQGSHSLVSMLNTDALVILPADRGEFRAGDVLRAILRNTPNSSEFQR